LDKLDMKATAIDIRQCFQPVLGTHPWRVKLGVGSFLTFEFGARIKAHGHIHGQWHLWVYLSNWALFHRDRQIADSDADRKIITAAARRLEEASLTGIEFDPRALKTTFLFNDFRLVVSPADYIENADERDDFWIFFMPNNEVLAVGPAGVRLEQADVSRHV
jgi:hypothetical protein